MQQQLYFWFEHLHIYSVQFRRSVVCASKKSFFLIPFPFHAVHITVSLVKQDIPLFPNISQIFYVWSIFCSCIFAFQCFLFRYLLSSTFHSDICVFHFLHVQLQMFVHSNIFCSDICVFHYFLFIYLCFPIFNVQIFVLSNIFCSYICAFCFLLAQLRAMLIDFPFSRRHD